MAAGLTERLWDMTEVCEMIDLARLVRRLNQSETLLRNWSALRNVTYLCYVSPG
jgi:hypothetical protein